MQANDFIRKYEQLKGKKTKNLNEKMILEKEWISLFKDIRHNIRKMSKNEKKKLEHFKNKTESEMHIISAEIYNSLTQNSKNNFKELLNKSTNEYLRFGSKGLVELHLKKSKSGESVHDKIDEAHLSEKVQNISLEEFKQKSQKLLNTNFKQNLDFAYDCENEFLFLSKWFESNKGKRLIDNDSESKKILNELMSHHLRLVSYIIQELNFSEKTKTYLKTKKQLKKIRKYGVLKAMNMLESSSQKPPAFTQEIMNSLGNEGLKNRFKDARNMKRHFTFHVGPTNSGKTYNAIQAFKKSEKGLYLAPIRLLALEIQESLTEEGIKCNLKTSDEKVFFEDAKHNSSIIEVADFKTEFEIAVIDEIQMISDEVRGSAWLEAIYGLKAKNIHLCGAEHAVDLIKKVIEDCGDTYEVIKYDRQTELIMEEERFEFPYSVRKGDALICFSKNEVVKHAAALKKEGYSVSVMYGKLPPATRKEQVKLFAAGETDVIVTTDVIGIGLNLPIERIVFLQTEKFDGRTKRKLTTQEVKQISGRAGRKGIYEKGFVNSLIDKDFISSKLNEYETPIKKGVISPQSEVFKLNKGTLLQRMKAWKRIPNNSSILLKSNIDGTISLLSKIEQFDHKFKEKDLKNILYVSFDQKNSELLDLWSQYTLEFLEEKKCFSKPKRKGNSNIELENYYQKLMIYKMMSKKLDKDFDNIWIKNEKYKITKMMNQSFSKHRKKLF